MTNGDEASDKKVLPKIEFSKIKEVSSKPIVKQIGKNALLAFYCYLIVFILDQILISGGMSEINVYFIIASCLFLIASQILLIRNKFYTDMKSTIISAATFLLVFALLDYLVINLWLENNNLELYKFWPMYFSYLIVAGMPFIRSKWDSANSPTLNSLLTKQERTL
jgi:hypothetical protein